MSGKKVLVALSGGVDSSVCVSLMKRQGCDVTGLVLSLSPAHEGTVRAAESVARALDIPLIVAREEEWFQREVVRPWAEAYRRGETPNPCIFCNPSTKFALLCREAKARGFCQVITGHYAGVRLREGRYLLKKAAFLPRDQSYMLYRLSQEQLSLLSLPLESLSKEEVRAIAAREGLPCANAPDSQEICFIPDNNYPAYIEKRFGPMPQGDFIGPDGRVCGHHKGLLHYTVGQRKGLGIALGRPVFIQSIDPQTNRIYLGESGEEYAAGVRLRDCRWIPFDRLPGSLRVGAKIRSAAKEAPASVTPLENGGAQVLFDTPQRAPAPGQSCVLYDGDWVLGGGYIEKQIL
ncbi:MAG: tRNA 2-thiouridine(34) synthase MnmA [Oscillospiraceae bacterium]|nr:tRNA 2-thiouridine(34) synthase MnmA [Oscillospiraceae bacterium]